jgi:glutamyl-tRNA synthetase
MKDYLEIIESTSANDFTATYLESQLRLFAEQKSIKPAVMIHPLRLALTGSTASPGIFELMEVLGKDEVLRRIKKPDNFQ